mgnify:FL=1
MIVLELTESTAINAPALMEHHMKELGDAGISFAMDDYGTGNANCSYLMRFPFREVKMDRDMTLAYFNNETARIVIENEIRTMQKLGIQMVVEGVEKLEQSEEMERLAWNISRGIIMENIAGNGMSAVYPQLQFGAGRLWKVKDKFYEYYQCNRYHEDIYREEAV